MRLRKLLTPSVRLTLLIAPLIGCAAASAKPIADPIELGPRPLYLVRDMADSPLKKRLEACEHKPVKRTDFSIGHRGAAMQFPEHSKESYQAAVDMGAGIVECDVTFTEDRALVCRHSQCDLHTTTNILAIPELAAKCTVPFTPADPVAGTPATAQCCTSDITLDEFRQLTAKMDSSNPQATTVEEYLGGNPTWRTELYSPTATVMTLEDSIAFNEAHGVKHTPELKTPSVPMPFQGDYTQEQFAQDMIDAYKQAGVSPDRVWPQSFLLDDVLYWIEHDPAYGKQAVYLDDINEPSEAPSYEELAELAGKGVRIVAPPLFAMLDVGPDDAIVASEYAKNAKAAGLDIIVWSLERSGPLQSGGGWYYQSVSDVVDDDGDMMNVVDVLAKDVGVIGIFSDWPATVTYYANCMGL